LDTLLLKIFIIEENICKPFSLFLVRDPHNRDRQAGYTRDRQILIEKDFEQTL